MKKFLLTALFALSLTAVAHDGKKVTVELKDAKGQDVGTAVITEHGKKGVEIALDLKNLPPGERAIHFHEKPACEPPFGSALMHFNPEKKQHGTKNPQGHHAGDMPNITIGTDGTLKTKIRNERVNLGDGEGSLFTNGGTSLMIHEKADDYSTDPAGNAGARIACAVVKKQ